MYDFMASVARDGTRNQRLVGQLSRERRIATGACLLRGSPAGSNPAGCPTLAQCGAKRVAGACTSDASITGSGMARTDHVLGERRKPKREPNRALVRVKAEGVTAVRVRR